MFRPIVQKETHPGAYQFVHRVPVNPTQILKKKFRQFLTIINCPCRKGKKEKDEDEEKEGGADEEEEDERRIRQDGS